MEPDAEEEVELQEGMPVSNEDGEALGTLAGMLVEEDEDEEEAEAEFVIVSHGGADRLVPYEAILGVGDGSLLLNVPAKAMDKFPKLRADTNPTEAETELAYHVYDENALYVDEDEE